MLEYTLTNDVLFKMVFTQRSDLLKSLVSALLSIPEDSITQFEITNSEIPPELYGDKFCRLDINMVVDGQRVDLEVQVQDEHNYRERSLYYWAREFSSALNSGSHYEDLPRTIIASILAFSLFDCDEYYSEFRPLEVKRHECLTDKQILYYFELPKLPKEIDTDDEMKLWLALFNAKTEEDLTKLEAMEVSVMNETIKTYRKVSVTPEFREIERMRERARLDEASALYHAGEVARKEERKKWQSVIANKDAAIANKDAAIANKDEAIANKDAEIARLRAQLGI